MKMGKVAVVCRIALLALFLSYYGGATLFSHTHDSASGQITHSHPYIPTGHHTHSAASFHFIDSVSHLPFVASVVGMVMVCATARFVFPIPHTTHIRAVVSRHCPLRAPPVY